MMKKKAFSTQTIFLNTRTFKQPNSMLMFEFLSKTPLMKYTRGVTSEEIYDGKFY